MKKKYPELVSLPDDLAHIPPCVRINLSDIEGLYKKLTGEVKKFSDRVESVISVINPSEAFCTVMKEFVDSVSKQLEETKAKYEKTEKIFNETKRYFDAKKTMGSNDMFDLFDKFLAYFKACDDRYEAELLKLEKEKTQTKRGTLVKRENAGKKIGGGAGGDGDPMMGIIAAIRAGKASGLKKSDLPTATRTSSGGNDDSEAEPEAVNPFAAFQLRKVNKAPAPKKEEPEPMNELQRMLNKRK